MNFGRKPKSPRKEWNSLPFAEKAIFLKMLSTRMWMSYPPKEEEEEETRERRMEERGKHEWKHVTRGKHDDDESHLWFDVSLLIHIDLIPNCRYLSFGYSASEMRPSERGNATERMEIRCQPTPQGGIPDRSTDLTVCEKSICSQSKAFRVKYL